MNNRIRRVLKDNGVANRDYDDKLNAILGNNKKHTQEETKKHINKYQGY